MFLRRIGDLREDHDLTQQDVANYLGCSREVYRRYEKGDRDLPVWALKMLCQRYHCSSDYILEITDIKNPVELLLEAERKKRSSPYGKKLSHKHLTERR